MLALLISHRRHSTTIGGMAKPNHRRIRRQIAATTEIPRTDERAKRGQRHGSRPCGPRRRGTRLGGAWGRGPRQERRRPSRRSGVRTTRVRADRFGTDMAGRPRPPHRALKDTALSKCCAGFSPLGSTQSPLPAPKLCVARTVCQRGRRVADSTSLLRGRIAVGCLPDGQGLRGCRCAGFAAVMPPSP